MNSQSDCKNTYCGYCAAIIGAFLIVAGLVWVMRSYTRPEPLGEDRAALRRKNLAELRAANTEVLYNKSFVWQDQAKGIVRMPIEQAMELTIRLWQNPVAARSNLVDRVEKATFVPPPPPAKPNPFD